MNSTIFTCSKCDGQALKWAGRCLECGAWGTLTEGTNNKIQSTRKTQKSNTKPSNEVVDLTQNSKLKTGNYHKLVTGFTEFDKVLGGGITPGSLILLGGDPGVGKSTMALQLASGFKEEVLYVSAEESADQVSGRLSRLVKGQGSLKFLKEDDLETILATIEDNQPQLVIIDSIQTIYLDEVKSLAGSINQLKACTVRLLECAKNNNISIILIGHVTKEGELAGPKTTEHLVDVVLYLEGDKYKQYRLLRAAKNRFGSTDEVAILEMTKEGLTAVANPSKIFLAESHQQPGAVICAVAEGSQIFLVEVQALVSKTTFNYPKRSSSGFDQKRLELLTTILSKRANINLANFDVYLNIAGGLTLKEPALDLAVCAAINSAYHDKVWPAKTVIFGEVGLAGEVRTVAKTKERLKESLKLGFTKIVLPSFEGEIKGVTAIKVKEVKEIAKLF
ncbi:MAG: DNA repair protein RadA [Patescibacteria group bacterium]|jgi:DNA repair protein RadA/Sms